MEGPVEYINDKKYKNILANLEGKDNVADMVVDGKIILKRILKVVCDDTDLIHVAVVRSSGRLL